MNIKILTMHAMHNPGSVLQAYATQQFLSKSHNVEIIDYRPSYFFTEKNSFKYYIKKFLFYRYYKSRSRKFDSFISDNMNLTKRINNYSDFTNSGIDADLYVLGSDQLWNSDYDCGRDPAYMLDFTDKPKISYATSVGKSVLNSFEKEWMLKYLCSFDAVSVRERSTAKQISIITNRDIEWVCDPVFLLQSKDYSKFIIKDIIINKPFVVIYLSESSDILNSIVDEFKKLGYSIILLGGFSKRCYCDIHIIDAGPIDFLSYIYFADYVISSSFHATAFCHIFHKKFATILPKKNSERISSLLSLSDLQDRAIISKVDMKAITSDVDWNDVDIRINKHIRDSVDFLNEAISSINSSNLED